MIFIKTEAELNQQSFILFMFPVQSHAHNKTNQNTFQKVIKSNHASLKLFGQISFEAKMHKN